MSIEELKNSEVLDLDKTIATNLFRGVEYPWEVLPLINGFILEYAANNLDNNADYIKLGDDVWIHKTAVVSDSAQVTGPTIICENAEIRHCAFIRGNVIVGKDAVVGNSTEVKNSILFDNCECPHYNYVGDSIIGFKAHMGAGSITSNLKSDKTNVTIKTDDSQIETGLRKMGAVLGNNVEIGCNSVLNPGTIVGSNSIIYPLSMVRGYVKDNVIYKAKDNVVSRI